MSKKHESLMRDAKEASKEHKAFVATLKKDELNREGPKWFSLIQQAKRMSIKSIALEREAERHLPKPERTLLEQQRKAREDYNAGSFDRWVAKSAKTSTYNYHPDINDRREDSVIQALSAFSGKHPIDVKQYADHLRNTESLSLTEAYRKIWSEYEIRDDKPLVSIDLEVASPTGNKWVDTGPYSNIIEVGVVRRDPDGTIDKFSFLNDVPKDFAKVYGTGAQHIHNISLDMIKNLPVFIDDARNTDKLKDFLEESVMVAHNAKYEVSQLSHNLYGFNTMMNNDLITVLDTQVISTYFLPETPNNRNESFVKAAGLPYEGAHRALADAEMTLTALLKLTGTI